MKLRDFEKVSKAQFLKDSKKCGSYYYDIADLAYDIIEIPRRATNRSCGYDFISPFYFYLDPNETTKFPLGIKAYMQEDEQLLVYPRSSVGFKFKIKIDNTVGLIDSDFYNNEDNEGNIHISLTNTGDKRWQVKSGDKICQGVFQKYLITDTDNPINKERKGGIGSTDE